MTFSTAFADFSASRLAPTGLVLAGGRSRRMGGGDKALVALAGRPMVAYGIERVRPQVAALLLNANGDPTRFEAFGLPVVADVVEGYAGPLAGVLTGLEWMAARAPDAAWLLTVPADAPFLPPDLVWRLRAAVEREGADLACAASGGRVHPVVGLWPVRLRHALRAAVIAEGVRRVEAWTARYRLARVEFESQPLDPFFNINRPEDAAAAERWLRTEAPAGPGTAPTPPGWPGPRGCGPDGRG